MTAVITAGLDGSPESLAAADWAAREAVSRGATLCLLHAWTLLEPEPETVQIPDHNQAAKAVMNEAARAIVERHPQLAVSEELVAMEPAAALLRAAEDCELLVLGSQGIGLVAGYLTGAVALHVAARCACPVVLVRAPQTDGNEGRGPRPEETFADPGPDTGGGHIVVGLPTNQPAEKLLDFAFKSAARDEAALHAVQALRLPPPLYGRAYSAAVSQLTDEGVLSVREQMARVLAPWRERYPSVRIVDSVRTRSPARALLGECAGARLLVVGRHRHPAALHPRLGHVTQAAVHHAPCPVAIVPHG